MIQQLLNNPAVMATLSRIGPIMRGANMGAMSAPISGDILRNMAPAIQQRMQAAQPQSATSLPDAGIGNGYAIPQNPNDRVSDAFKALGPQPSVPMPRPRPQPMDEFSGGGSYAQAFPTPVGDAPRNIPGFNPNVGNMADPSQMIYGPLAARQVMDPATGNMMNDFYNPNTGHDLIKKYLGYFSGGR